MNEFLIEKITKEAIEGLESMPLEDLALSDEYINMLREEGVPVEGLEAVRKVSPYVLKTVRKRILPSPIVKNRIKEAIEKNIPEIKKIEGESRFYYHGKIPKGGKIEYFSSKTAGERFNFEKDGIQPDKDLKIIGLTAFFSPPIIQSFNDLKDVIIKIMEADVSLMIEKSEKLSFPLEFIIDFNPHSAIATTETAKTIEHIFFKNSRLERGFLPIQNVVLPFQKTLSLKVTFKESYNNTAYTLFFGILAKEI